MYFDRFDICEAYYLFLSNYHEGMMSLKYKRLSRVLRYFKPSPLLCVERLSSNGKEIYESLCQKETTNRETFYYPTTMPSYRRVPRT